MPGTTTQFKLGLLAIAALAGIIAIAFGLGWRSTRTQQVRYHTYFDESVQGLELGSPVKYRGVRIGNVADISIAPDRKHVRVGLAIRAADVERLDLAHTSPDLRAELATQGITGVKFVDLDFVLPGAPPPTPLKFAPGPNYIPSRRSLLAGLERQLEPHRQRSSGAGDTECQAAREADRQDRARSDPGRDL